MTETPYFTTLKGRGLIRIEGAERTSFLQNLVTNDTAQATQDMAVYACLLSPQGKFLHDFFISENSDALLLECEGGARAQDLYRRLNMYCLRADANISLEADIPIYAALGRADVLAQIKDTHPDSYFDPRHTEMGWRGFTQPKDIPEQPLEKWDQHRIYKCVPDGSRDLIPATSTMDEARMDVLNAIDYEKGCYIGQELTARIHYRGLGKKHLYVVKGTLPKSGEKIVGDNGKIIGQMRSQSGDVGLALLKDGETENLPQSLKLVADTEK